MGADFDEEGRQNEDLLYHQGPERVHYSIFQPECELKSMNCRLNQFFLLLLLHRSATIKGQREDEAILSNNRQYIVLTLLLQNLPGPLGLQGFDVGQI